MTLNTFTYVQRSEINITPRGCYTGRSLNSLEKRKKQDILWVAKGVTKAKIVYFSN